MIATIVVSSSIITACGGSSDGVESVVLDQPGEYQQPTIALNRKLTGSALATEIVFDRDGTEVDLARFVGRPLVVNFWFSDCPPCKREMPALQTAHETWGDDVVFIGVNPVDSQDRMIDFGADMGVTYELLRDPDSELLVANGITTFPTTLFVDADGEVVEQISGELTDDVLAAVIEEMLA